MKIDVISMSLYGTNLMYYKGALENAKLLPQFYPNWILRIYYDDSVDNIFIKLLASFKNIQLVKMPLARGIEGMYWRYLANDDAMVNRYMVRDIDSRFNIRERAAVNDWIKSSKSFHIMRDHPMHRYKIQGGMWSGTAGKFNIINLINQYASKDKWGQDEDFLSNHVYPIIQSDCIIHDKNNQQYPWPVHESYQQYVGQKFSVYNIPL